MCIRDSFTGTVAAYRGREVLTTVVIDGETYENVPVTIPTDASVTVSSGYRNPQRNRAVGSLFPDSRHTRGRALDMSPSAVQVTVQVPVDNPTITRRVALDLHETLYPALDAAAGTQGTAICEDGNVQLDCTNTRTDHVHLQW